MHTLASGMKKHYFYMKIASFGSFIQLAGCNFGVLKQKQYYELLL